MGLHSFSNVHSAEDALKAVAGGATVAMLTSILLERGMREWLAKNEYESLAQLRGSLSQANCPAPAAFEHANFVQLVGSYDPDIMNYDRL